MKVFRKKQKKETMKTQGEDRKNILKETVQTHGKSMISLKNQKHLMEKLIKLRDKQEEMENKFNHYLSVLGAEVEKRELQNGQITEEIKALRKELLRQRGQMDRMKKQKRNGEKTDRNKLKKRNASKTLKFLNCNPSLMFGIEKPALMSNTKTIIDTTGSMFRMISNHKRENRT